MDTGLFVSPPADDGADAFTLVCRSIRQETPDAKSYTFAEAGGAPLPFRAGQFLNLTFEVGGQSVTRSYSISSSSANTSRVSITVKRIAGGVVSNWLFDELKVGDRVGAEGPMGAFTDEGVEGPILLLSAGSGVTPVASIIRSYVDLCDDRDVVCLHFARSPEDMLFASEFSSWTKALPGFRAVLVASQPAKGTGWVGPTGRIGHAIVNALVPDIARRAVFICGPEGFMEAAREIAAAAGVAQDRIFRESFLTAEVADVEPEPSARSFEITFAKSGKSAPCGAGTTVLQVAKSAKVNIQTSCGKGICGTCRVKLASGTVEMVHGGGIKQREIDAGFILACCSKPTSDLVVDR